MYVEVGYGGGGVYVGVVLYVKRVFGLWESINPSRQFPRFIDGVTLPTRA
jgi:hypothetical protein